MFRINLRVYEFFNLLLRNWKLFLFNFIAIFALVFLQKIGVNISNFVKDQQVMVSPVSTKEDSLDKLLPKLEEKKNTFKIKKENSFLISPVSAAGEFEQARAYGVVDLNTGDVLIEKNLSEPVSIASITKVMTAVVALDLVSPDELFTVSERAASIEPTKIGVVAGERMKVSELIDAAILTSANDAVEVIKEGVDTKYGAGTFVKAMNAKAKIIGLKNTNYANPQGFDNKNHYSSVEDLSILAHYALENYPLFKETAHKEYQFLGADSNHKQFDLYNWNGLLGVYPGATGIKIGNTDRAGYTTLVTSEREGKRLAVVLLGAPGVLERDLWASQLLDIGFEKLGLKSVNITKEDLKEKYATWKYW